MSVRALFYQCIPAAAGGYAKFFEPGTADLKTTYASDYTTAATLNSAGGVAINSSGILKTYLLGDYDMLVYDSTGTQLTNLAASGLNPQESDIENAVNLLSNGSFEVDSNGDSLPDEWTVSAYTGGTVSLDSSDKAQGVKSLKFVSTGTGGGTAISDNFIEVSPERLVDVSFLLKSTADVRNLVELIWYTAAEVEISTTTVYDNSATNPTSWAIRGGVFVPPATAYYCKIKIYGCHSSDSTAGTARFDGVFITLWDSEVQTVASASSVNLNAVVGKSCHISGTTGISTITLAEGRVLEVVFDGALTITNGSSLLLPGGANVTTVADDSAVFLGEASGVVRCLRYSRKALAVSGYVSYGNAYINTDRSHATAFDIDAVVTEGTFESLGPTGSGATNIWTAMNDIPTGATVAFISAHETAGLAAADSEASVDLFVRGVGSAVAAGEQNRVCEIGANADSTVRHTDGFIPCPLDSSRVFEITWSASGENARSVNVRLVGFGVPLGR